MTVNETTYNCPDTDHRIVLGIYIVIVTFLNVLLLYFIRYRTVQGMRDYTIVLYTTTIIDFVSAWTQAAIGIRISLQNDMQIHNLDGFLPALIGDWEIFAGGRLHYLSMIETFFAAFSLAFGPVPFIYRYFVVCRSYKLSPTQFFLITAFLGCFTFYTASSYAITANMFYDENIGTIALDPNCLRSLTSWTADQSSKPKYGWIGFWLLHGRFYGLSCILYSYALIFVCGWRIQVALGKQVQLFETKKAKLIQRELNCIIWMQALVPFCVCGSSLIFYYIAIHTNQFKLEAFTLQFYAFMIFPLLNPCISMMFISEYRRSYINFWRQIVNIGLGYNDWKVSPTANRNTSNTA